MRENPSRKFDGRLTPVHGILASLALASAAFAQPQFDELAKRHLPIEENMSVCNAMGDVDGDGDLDLVFGNSESQDRLYLNNGNGFFTDATATHLPPPPNPNTASVALVDVEGDGDPDLVLGSLGQNMLFLNDGAGVFADATAARMPVDGHLANDLVAGDVDGDGDQDVVFACNLRQNRLYLNDGRGTFTNSTARRMQLLHTLTEAVATGDVDGDGDPDMVLGNWFSPRLQVNDGFGNFVDVSIGRMPSNLGYIRDAALCDVDGDGDLDAVFAAGYFDFVFWISGERNRLCLNDGTGTFADATVSHMPAIVAESSALAIGDVDSDGDPDLVFGNESGLGGIGAQNRLYVNTGNGTFIDGTASHMPQIRHNSSDVVLFDADGDGDLDLVVGNLGQQNRLALNDGRGRFTDVTASRMPVDSDDTRCILTGDVDGDGDLDLFLGNGRTGGEQNRLYSNDGRGFFTDVTASRLPAINDSTWSVALFDVDGDGDSDLVLGNFDTEQDEVWLNDGSGTFTDVTAAGLLVHFELTVSLAPCDVDRDGDLDLVIGNYVGNFWEVQSPVRLYLNLIRQVDSPLLLRPGRDFQIDVYDRSRPPGPVTAIPFIGTGPANIPVPPFGTLGIDPSQLLLLAPLVIPQPQGVASTSFPVPNNPNLAGLRVYSQAALLQSPGPRLTNATVDVVFP